MSDGERVILYMMGQCLLAPQDSAIIIDEPELHIHKAPMARMWDIIEAERKDCCFIYITHDLDFATSRLSANKYAIRSFNFPLSWQIEKVPSQAFLPEAVYNEILGSRQPILFVEGQRGSLDTLTYSQAYPKFLIEAVGGCEAVIHAVSTFNKNRELHRFVARGCVDADARSKEEIDRLRGLDVYVLPLAEIENVYLLPDVFDALAEAFLFIPDERNNKFFELKAKLIGEIQRTKDQITMRYTSRIVDARLKRAGSKAKSLDDFKKALTDAISEINIDDIVNDFQTKLEKALAEGDLSSLLAAVDHKGILNIGEKVLGSGNMKELTVYSMRTITSTPSGRLTIALRAALPTITGPEVLEVGHSLPSDIIVQELSSPNTIVSEST